MFLLKAVRRQSRIYQVFLNLQDLNVFKTLLESEGFMVTYLFTNEAIDGSYKVWSV